jgi:hypothetical protein
MLRCLPLYATETVRYLPSDGSMAANSDFFWNTAAVRSATDVPCLSADAGVTHAIELTVYDLLLEETSGA